MALYPDKNAPYVSVQEACKDNRGNMSILAFCLTFPICSHRVMSILNDHLVDDERYDKIRERISMDSDEPSDYWPMQRVLPKRLFTDLERASTSLPPSDSPDVDVHAVLNVLGRLGPAPTLHTNDLLVMLRALLFHHDGHKLLITDSDDAYSLTKAVFAQDEGLTRLLVGFDGQAAKAKEGLPLKVAVRANWLTGVKILLNVPQSKKERRKFREVCDELRELFDEATGRHDAALRKLSLTTPDEGKRMRDYLLNPDLLHTAIRSEAHDVAKWLMEEEKVPLDIKTIQYLERAEARGDSSASAPMATSGSSSGGGGGGGGSKSARGKKESEASRGKKRRREG